MVNSSIDENNTVRCDQWLKLLDELTIGAFTADIRRKLRAINYSAQALIGMREKEVLGRDCREIFTGVPCMVKCLVANPKGEPAQGVDLEVIDENFERHLITRIATPIYDLKKNVVGCLTILQDHSPITDLIDRVHYEERSLKMILDNLDIGVFTVNRGGLITFFNTAAEKISGYSRRQLLGKSCGAIFTGSKARDLRLLQDAIGDGEQRSISKGTLVDSDGGRIPVRAKYMALRNEKDAVVGGIATFQDLTLIQQLTKAVSDRYTFRDMIGKDPAMQKIFEMVTVVARSDATVLIEGSTGTGKDLLAKVIHAASPRADRVMVKTNCAAIPENLLESELFGYVKGAFTGADRDKPGRFQEADGGTIFLDEIGDLPLALQAKLLRVLEDREFYPLGSRHTRKVDVRIISATNRKLEKLVSERLFREDLYYRLNVLRIELPPLQQRRSDIPLLIHHIIRQLCAAREIRPPKISNSAMKILLNAEYPGNVRELENILEHALIIGQESVIKPHHLPDYLLHPMTVESPSEEEDTVGGSIADPEAQRIHKALTRCNGNRKEAARLLGIDRTTLWRKMKRLNLNF